MMRMVSLEEAVGQPLAHDITEIRPGEFKGPAFRRGHIVDCHDLEHLRRLGKEHLYILRPESDELHEDEAAVQIANALCGEGVGWEGRPREGKITLKATRDGLFKVEVNALTRFNVLGEVMCATIHSNMLVKLGERVAATRAIPLLIKRDQVEQAVRIAREGEAVLRVVPLRRVNAGVIITGNEVYYGRIQDRFEPIIRKKVESLGGKVLDVVFLPDDDQLIAQAALDLIALGADLLITTGGMSVDPDDRTRFGLEKAGARDILYGSAVLPGAMFMLAHLSEVPVLGIPACGLHAQATVFDLLYPRILAGERLTREDLARLGHGGLCLKCDPCHFPVCPFGKGSG
jgi:hypothetical protein